MQLIEMLGMLRETSSKRADVLLSAPCTISRLRQLTGDVLVCAGSSQDHDGCGSAARDSWLDEERIPWSGGDVDQSGGDGDGFLEGHLNGLVLREATSGAVDLGDGVDAAQLRKVDIEEAEEEQHNERSELHGR